MAETDVLYEFGREPGFSCLVFGPERSVRHGGPTEEPVRFIESIYLYISVYLGIC